MVGVRPDLHNATRSMVTDGTRTGFWPAASSRACPSGSSHRPHVGVRQVAELHPAAQPDPRPHGVTAAMVKDNSSGLHQRDVGRAPNTQRQRQGVGLAALSRSPIRSRDVAEHIQAVFDPMSATQLLGPDSRILTPRQLRQRISQFTEERVSLREATRTG